MRHFLSILTILASLTLCAPSQAQQLKTVMVNTNGVLQFPTNFWQANAGTYFQQFIASNNFAHSGDTTSFSTNRGQNILIQRNVLNVVSQTNLGIDLPHALLAANNNIWAFKRQQLSVSGNASGVVFSNAASNFSNSTILTLTNGGSIPDAVYDSSNNIIYAASTHGGVFAINASNNAISSLATNNIDILGAIAQDASHIYLGWSNIVQKVSKSNGATVASITNTNVGDIHALKVTPDQSRLIGTTAQTPGVAFVVTLSNFVFSQVATYSSTNASIFTDDMALDNSNAFLGAEGGFGALVRYNLVSNTFTEIATDNKFYVVSDLDGLIFASGPSGAASVSKDGSLYREIYTPEPWNEVATIGTNVFVTEYTSTTAIIAKVAFDYSLARMSRRDVAVNPVVTNLVLTNTNTVGIADDGVFLERFVWAKVTPSNQTGNLNVGSFMVGNNRERRAGDALVVENVGTNDLNIRRGVVNPPIIATLRPGQVFNVLALESTGSGTTWFTNSIATLGFSTNLSVLWSASNASAAMRGLSGSTNTNHPFSGTVSVVGTNNTNTLTFSNGILQSVQ